MRIEFDNENIELVSEIAFIIFSLPISPLRNIKSKLQNIYFGYAREFSGVARGGAGGPPPPMGKIVVEK